MALSKQEVDARVQAAVENLQAGRGVEDDAGIEFKADWPDPATKARQLAGAANALRGDAFILVVGVDDASGAITVPDKTEPQEWYAKVRKPFDQISPELLWVQTVFVGENPKSVLALVFATDEFPYVINANNRREVPLRVATGTESAHRNQLVRMFDPSIRVPEMSITVASVQADWEDKPRVAANPTGQHEQVWEVSLALTLDARVLIEQNSRQPSTLPVRDMRARVVCGDFETRPKVRVRHLGQRDHPVIIAQGDPYPQEPVPPQHGVYARDQHVVATSPGEFTISTRVVLGESRPRPDREMQDWHDFFVTQHEMRLDLAIRVVGVERQVKLSAPLRVRSGSREATRGFGLSEVLGLWELDAVESDPWG